MLINQNNYQAWFLDYWDNSLDASQQQELATFLQNHPDLQDEFLEFKDAALCTFTPDDALVFEPKLKLKKKEVIPTENINQDNYEDFIIAHLERDLDEMQQAEFASFTAINPTIENEIALYKRTFLKASDYESYPDKEKLKKSAFLVPPRQYIISALSIAALLVLVLMITNSLLRQPAENPAKTARHEMVLQPLSPQETPTVQVEKPADDGSVNSANVAAKQIAAHPSHYYDISDKSSFKTNSALPVRENLPLPSPIETRQQWGLEYQFAANQTLDYRTEVTEAFGYMLLRDARAAQPEPSGGVLARIAGSIVGKLFDNATLQQQEALATLSQNSRQLLMDIKEDMPLLDAATQADPRENYYALSENFSIRIRKAPKNEQ